METKKNVALITGVTGQDGSYLSEFLLEKGYEVHGVIRRSSVDYRERIAHLEGRKNFHLHYADMGDSMSLVKLVGKVMPQKYITWPHRATYRYRSMPQSILPMPMQWVCFAYWRRCAPIIWRKPAEYTRHLPASFTARWKKCLRMRIPRSIHTPHTLWRNSTVTGLSGSTARPTACTAALASSSTMRVSAEERPS